MMPTPPHNSNACPDMEAEQPYSLALAADNLLVALEAGSGRQLACFTISGPAQAADPTFLSWVQQQLGELAGGTAEHVQHAQQAGAGSTSSGAGGATNEDQELNHLLRLMMVGDSTAAAPAAAAALVTGAAGADTSGTAAAPAGAQQPCSPAKELWFDAPEEQAMEDWQLDGLDWRQLQQRVGEGWGAQHWQHGGGGHEREEDWRLAAQLQAEEDAAIAAAAAEEPLSPSADQQNLQLSDWELAQRFQEEEDARLAAALAEQERTAGASAAKAAAQHSSSFWARLRPAGAANAEGSGGDTGASATVPGSSFPALQAQLPANQQAVERTERVRRQLLAQHRRAKQAARERGSGVRLLHHVGRPASPDARPAQQALSLVGGGDAGSRLPPLQLEGGLVLHEDDLDYQLLLRDDDVTTAARDAAARHADLSEAAADAGALANAAGTTTAAMRSMIDAAARAGSSRPGSAQGGAPPPGGPSQPGFTAASEATSDAAGAAAVGGAAARAVGGAAEAGPAGTGPFVDSTAPVDTKSLRRLVEDMRRRGWRLLGSAGGGHLRCERVLPDLPGFKQVYFLCSTPSDVNYIWNVAAAVKRFDREVEERRAEGAAVLSHAGADGTGSNWGGTRGWQPPNRQRR
ncbi:hypothetical protein ABPG77_000596 [Micractinium sp. CCAP 211/92]